MPHNVQLGTEYRPKRPWIDEADSSIYKAYFTGY